MSPFSAKERFARKAPEKFKWKICKEKENKQEEDKQKEDQQTKAKKKEV